MYVACDEICLRFGVRSVSSWGVWGSRREDLTPKVYGVYE